MITFSQTGNFKNTENFLKRVLRSDHGKLLHRYGQEGVNALMMNTPLNTGQTAQSWTYSVINSKNRLGIQWHNHNVTKSGTPVVILLQYGHGTRGGGYVQGYDFINPVIQPIFDRIAEEIWREVTSR